MKTLIAFEFRKLLHRKMLWVSLALAMGLFALVNSSALESYRFSGYARGMKDIYRQYEGQVLTEELQAQVQKEYNSYVAAHPGSFEPNSFTDDAGKLYTEYFPRGWGYITGVWQAYNNLANESSLEDEQERVRWAEERLAAGIDDQGNPLTYTERQYMRETVQNGVIVPVVHYVRGWFEYFYNSEPLTGILVMAVTGMALLGLFNGEVSSRMEAILLTARARRRAAWAKLLAAGLIAAGGAALFFGLQFAIIALAWGLEGAALPLNAFGAGFSASSITILLAFILSASALVLAAVSIGSIVAWASARFRNALLSLLVAGAIMGSVIALQDNLLTLFINQQGSQLFFAIDRIDGWLNLFPPNVLIRSCDLSGNMQDPARLIFLMLFPAALSALLFWAAQRVFLRRRKA